MKYRAIVNLDFTNQVTNEYTRLKLALVHSKWLFVETSAFIIETDNLAEVWRGIELVAKQCAAAGDLSALTFHIQGADGFATSLNITTDLSPANALRDILAKEFPTP